MRRLADRPRLRSPFACASLLLAATAIAAWAEAPPAASSEPAAPALEGLYSHAEVRGPRGSFTTTIVSLADGRARFVQAHPEPRGKAELLAVGDVAFERNAAGAFVPAAAGTAAFVQGHDVPRLALPALALAAQSGSGRPERLALTPPPGSAGGDVTIELGGWRTAVGYDLPFAVTFVHAGERYVYSYTAVLPFRLAPGSSLPDDPAALFARLGDLGELVAAHERVMAAHRASDAEALLADAAEKGINSGRGELADSTRAAALERMRGYLGAIRFAKYEDTAVPVVAVSADGTLGWLACEIEAEGTRTVAEGSKSEPLAYAFSWVELYARDAAANAGDSRWLAIGNASSARP